MKLHLILLFIFIQISSYTFIAKSQPKQIKKADEYFNEFNYKKALYEYIDLEKEGIALYYVTHKIGDCYRHLGQINQAINWYLKAISYPDVDYTTYYILSHELRKKERYEEAEEYLQEYYRLSGNHSPKTALTLEELVTQLKEDSANFVIHQLSINSKFSEFGPAIYGDQLVFASNREKIQVVKRQDVRDGNHFYKLYVSKKNELISLSEPILFDQNLSSKYNDGPIAFNQDKSISFTTRNVVVSSDKKSYLNVFVNYKVGGKWKRKSNAIPLHQYNFSYMHAFLTQDDKRLFFVSDMEGGYGGFDIYYSYYKNGFLSSPVNLGPNINTEANELFPYVKNDGKLYFSSDKRGGLGGLDIFFSMPEDEGFSQSFNMGYPINTSSDDFSLVFEDDDLSGYFCSNREGGMGEDDIYAFQQKREVDYTRYSGVVINEESNEPISEARVSIYNGSKLISYVETNEEGEFYFYLRNNQNLTLEVKKRYFNNYKKDLFSVAKVNSDGYVLEVNLTEY